MPTTAVLDATGRLRWLDVHPDYTTRSEPDAILDALEQATDRWLVVSPGGAPRRCSKRGAAIK